MDSEQVFVKSGERVESLPGYVYVGSSSESEEGLLLYEEWRTLRIIGLKKVEGTGKRKLNLAVTEDEWDNPKKYECEKFPDTHPLKELRAKKRVLPAHARKKAALEENIMSKAEVEEALRKEARKGSYTWCPPATPGPKANRPQKTCEPAPQETTAEEYRHITLHPKAESKFGIRISIGANGKKVRVNELNPRHTEKWKGELSPGTYGAELMTAGGIEQLALDTSEMPLSFVLPLATLRQMLRPEYGYDIQVKGLYK